MSVDPRFFRIVDGIRAGDLANRIGALISSGEADQIISGVMVGIRKGHFGVP